MASWRDEYIQALRDRDDREKATYQRIDEEYIEACDFLPNSSTILTTNKLWQTHTYWIGH